MASRSKHRSQDMGVLQDTGPRATRVEWVAGVRPDPPAGEVAAASPSAGRGSGGNPFQQPGPGTQAATVPRGDLFAGVDTRLRAIAGALDAGPERDALAASLDSVSSEVTALRGELAASRLDATVPRLREVVALLEAASRRLESASIDRDQRTVASDLVAEKLELAREALAVGAGWVLDAYTESSALVPGEAATVRATFYNGGAGAARVTPALRRARVEGLAGSGGRGARSGGRRARELGHLRFAVPASAQPTVPYFLAAPRQGDLYDWSGVPAAVRGEPFAPPILAAAFAVEAAGARYQLEREVVHRFRDQAVGERRRPLRVVPALEVSVSPDRVLWPIGADGERTLRVALRKHVAGAVAGRIEVAPPPGWPAIAPVEFALEAGRDSRAYELRLARGERATDDAVAAVRVSAVLDGGGVMTGAYPLIEYPHIDAVPSPHRSAVEVRSLELELPELDAIGYVRGASDRVPESLLEVGVPLRLLSGEQILDLGEAGLDRFDAIVLGSRAYEADERLGEANQRLLDYVRGGGLLIVQYQQYDFVQRGWAPFPITIARPHDRITDEESPVEALAADERRAAAPARDRRRRLGGLGPGARPLLRAHLGPGLPAGAAHDRPRSAAAGRRPADRAARQGDLRLHRARVLPPAPRRRAGRVPVVHEPARARRLTADSSAMAARMRALRIGKSLWTDGHRPYQRYPTLRGRYEVDVAIVGGGITGGIAASLFAQAGVSVALVEAQLVARGSTAASSALLLKEPDAGLSGLTKKYGARAARRIWTLSAAAVGELVKALRDLDIACELSAQRSVYYTRSSEGLEQLKSELALRRQIRSSVEWLTPGELRRLTGISGRGALLTQQRADRSLPGRTGLRA